MGRVLGPTHQVQGRERGVSAGSGGEMPPGMMRCRKYQGTPLPWVRGGGDGLRRAQPDPMAGPSWRQEALGLSPCPHPPGRVSSNLPWVQGIQWGLRCLDLPVEEQRVVDATPAAGTGASGWAGCGEGTHLSPLLSRLSRLTHVALGALKADHRERNKGGIGPGELLGGSKTVVLGLGGQVTITAPPRDP